MVAAPVLWNSLPLSVRQAKDIDDFKRSVKYYSVKAFLLRFSAQGYKLDYRLVGSFIIYLKFVITYYIKCNALLIIFIEKAQHK